MRAEKWLGVKRSALDTQVALGGGLSGLILLVEEDRDGDGGQDGDDDHDRIVSRIQTSVKSGSALC